MVVERDGVQAGEQLPLVLVDPLHLHVKDGVWVHLNLQSLFCFDKHKYGHKIFLTKTNDRTAEIMFQYYNQVEFTQFEYNFT